MSETFNIRPAQAGDWDAVRQLLPACGLPITGVQEHLEAAYVVAACGEAAIGVAGIEVYGDYGLLRSVAVSPAWRGRSVGRALVQNRVVWAKDQGLIRVYLLTIDTAGYFEQYGFAAVEREAVPDEVKAAGEFASVCPETAVAMVKLVNPPV
jgi:amino-acid N-acetyltransferase